MPELWFYHLEKRRLENVLPDLLEKTLQRGWRALVQAGTSERVDALDTHLWTYTDESFLPHGTVSSHEPEQQPILLTAAGDNINGADVLFLVENAHLIPLTGERVAAYKRCILIFDGVDAAAVEAARAQWRLAKEAGIEVAYWQEDGGRWTKKA